MSEQFTLRTSWLSWRGALVALLLAGTFAWSGARPQRPAPEGPHVVFVIGEDEYRTAETLPAFARQELAPLGFRLTFVHADPADPHRFPGLEAVEEADLVVLSVRRRTPSRAQLDLLRGYVRAGKPLLALRTSSHAFALRRGAPPEGHADWPGFDVEVLGGRYENHYDNRSGTDVFIDPPAGRHPILEGVREPSFHSDGTLYRSRDLAPETTVLLRGRALDGDEPVTEPVAWTYTAHGRVFYTSLGHPSDFDQPAFRRLLVNAVHWALDRALPPGELRSAATPEVARYMQAFEGRGAVEADAALLSPEAARQAFRVPDDLAVDLVAAEPTIHQPVSISFDHRGRLWVVQYNQYPYPEGLKVTAYDHHLRAQFDTVPPPPPGGRRGADRITMLEDTDGDGTFDRATDVLSGLNIVTSVAVGRGGLWVLNPPYLLFYPDPDGDGRPDGEPVVHLRGFGLEDTHAVANSLTWGPDGWLYGAQGSTTTARVSSAVTKDVAFLGQAIWRYHPETQVFELFAEGGGNTFYVEFDSKGRLYSGHNGSGRGFHYVQGGYYRKSWGKHGPLTNPYSFGFLDVMPHEGDTRRFTHAGLVYEGGALPRRYDGALLTINPLQGEVQVSAMEADGSSYRTVDRERLAETPDHWFRPVDLKLGPDGAVYVADWYDSRLSHVDPRDNWHRASGRIYRIRAKEAGPVAPFDLSRYGTAELVALLRHPNEWYRRQALRVFGDRKDRSAVPALRRLVAEETGQPALEALWALHLSGGFDEAFALEALGHTDPYVRLWTVRLLGDRRTVSPAVAARLAALARTEPHAQVRSQLASSAKRLPGPAALLIVEALLGRSEDADDPHLPLLVWWALEDKAETDRAAVLRLFEDPAFWERPLVAETILGRLMQRYAMAGGAANLAAAARLLDLAPRAVHARALVTGLQEALRGQEAAGLPGALAEALRRSQQEAGGDLALALRQGQEAALTQALAVVADEAADVTERLAYLQVLGEVHQPRAVPVLLKLLGRSPSWAVRRAALQALMRYDDPGIGRTVAGLYPDVLRADPDVRVVALDLLASRPAWAAALAEAVTLHRIDTAEVPLHVVQKLLLHEDPALDALVAAHWPEARQQPSAERQARIAEITALLRSGRGDPEAGRQVFGAACGACHRLQGEGGTIGPDLTGYDRSNVEDLLFNTVDPSADIREGYVHYAVTTKDGRTLTGFLAERSGHTVTLRSLSGLETVLPAERIVEMQAQSVSVMPEGLLDRLTEQEVRDLFAYLRRP